MGADLSNGNVWVAAASGADAGKVQIQGDAGVEVISPQGDVSLAADAGVVDISGVTINLAASTSLTVASTTNDVAIAAQNARCPCTRTAALVPMRLS